MRDLTVDANEVLELIHCAEDYGFENSVLFSSFAVMLNNELSDEEIEEYAQSYLTDEMRAGGYGEGDYDVAVEKLNKFRERYIKQ